MLENALKRIVAETRGQLVSYREKTDRFRSPHTSLEVDLMGLCGISHCMLINAFENAALSSKGFAVQSLPKCYGGHVAVSLKVSRDLYYLVDPTFMQFLNMIGTSPITRLHQSKAGKSLSNQLVEDSFFRVTEKSTMLYISSFYSSDNPLEFAPEDALNFIQSPPDCEDLDCVGPKDTSFNDPEVLAKNGLIVSFN